MIRVNFVTSVAALLTSLPSVAETVSYQGQNAQEQPCTVSVDYAGEGVTSVSLEGVFKVTYTIPTPGSGLFGDYYWPGQFNTSRNLAGGFTSRKRLLGDGLVLSGQGKPVFYDEPLVMHEIVTTGPLDGLTAVSYDSNDALIVFVSIQCHGLSNTALRLNGRRSRVSKAESPSNFL